MTDELDPLRDVRPDRLLPDDPPDPHPLAVERERLVSHITGSPADTAWTPSIYPRLAYRDERAALDFLVRVFGFNERREARQEYPDGMLAWLEVGGGLVMIGRAGPDHHGLRSPVDSGAPTAMIIVHVADVDAHYRRSVAEGARIVTGLGDMFWGERRYEALDLEGHRWHFASA
jgi:uncharacterized glyoxalase superfamily protein PhnB